MTVSMKDYWNSIYASREPTQLGWYQEVPEASMHLLSRCRLTRTDPILDVGAGATVFIDRLLEEGYRNIIAADISEIALGKLKERLGREKASEIRWIVEDITNPHLLQNLTDVALWHDRAALHFLLDEAHRKTYLYTLEEVVRSGGYVIIAAFNLQGAATCSGLPVMRYDHQMLADFLGDGFKLVEHFDYTHRMPSGDPRPYVYTLFQRE